MKIEGENYFVLIMKYSTHYTFMIKESYQIIFYMKLL